MSINFDFPFNLDFSLTTGLCNQCESIKRYLSSMKGLFLDEGERAELETREDQIVYEFYKQSVPETAGDIEFGTSIVYPGLVGQEYFMTSGHFHNILETAEVYLCLQGEGYMMQESPEGEWDAIRLRPGTAAYCPKRFAHRSINTSHVPLVTFYAFRADAGHNYGIIKELGFKKLVVMKNGRPEIIDNPKRNGPC